MPAASPELLDATRRRLADLEPDAELATAAAELFAVAGVLDANPRLRRVTTDPDLPGAARRAVLRDVFGGKVGRATLDVLELVVDHARLAPRDVADAVVDQAAEAEVTRAERGGALERLVDELLGAADVLEEHPALRWTVADATSAGAAAALLGDVFGGKVDRLTLDVLEGAVQARRGAELHTIAREIADRAAERRRRTVAEVRTAVELDPERRSRIAAAIGRRLGHDVEVRAVVDPAVIGSVLVKVGDQVIDGTVRHQLELARAALAG